MRFTQSSDFLLGVRGLQNRDNIKMIRNRALESFLGQWMQQMIGFEHRQNNRLDG